MKKTFYMTAVIACAFSAKAMQPLNPQQLNNPEQEGTVLTQGTVPVNLNNRPQAVINYDKLYSNFMAFGQHIRNSLAFPMQQTPHSALVGPLATQKLHQNENIKMGNAAASSAAAASFDATESSSEDEENLKAATLGSHQNHGILKVITKKEFNDLEKDENYQEYEKNYLPRITQSKKLTDESKAKIFLKAFFLKRYYYDYLPEEIQKQITKTSFQKAMSYLKKNEDLAKELDLPPKQEHRKQRIKHGETSPITEEAYSSLENSSEYKKYEQEFLNRVYNSAQRYSIEDAKILIKSFYLKRYYHRLLPENIKPQITQERFEILISALKNDKKLAKKLNLPPKQKQNKRRKIEAAASGSSQLVILDSDSDEDTSSSEDSDSD